jgi:hypothetical protein
LPLGFRNSDHAADPSHSDEPTARVNVMAEHADVTDGLAIPLEQQMNVLRPPLEAEVCNAKRICAPAEEVLLFCRRHSLRSSNLETHRLT